MLIWLDDIHHAHPFHQSPRSFTHPPTPQPYNRSAQELWKRCAEAGDIYLDKYEGWYNVREETFVTEAEAKLSDFKDPVSGPCLLRRRRYRGCVMCA